jgi:hypothetical protein
MSGRRLFYDVETFRNSDFIGMSKDAQLAYFNLSLYADDDGFTKSGIIVLKVLGAKADVFTELEKAGFIYQFPSGVIVIRNWFRNNMIRKDRYTPTIYVNERKALQVLDNRYYLSDSQVGQSTTDLQGDGNQLATSWQPVGNQLATNGQPTDNRLAPQYKLRKDNQSEGNESEGKPVASQGQNISQNNDDLDRVVEYFNGQIHPASGSEKNELHFLSQKYGVDNCLNAIDRAVYRKHPKLSYVKGILAKWATDGYDEPKEVAKSRIDRYHVEF